MLETSFFEWRIRLDEFLGELTCPFVMVVKRISTGGTRIGELNLCDE